MPVEGRKACENSDAFRFEGNAKRTCDSFVAKKPNKRCKKKQLGTNIKLKFFCPSTCKRKCKKTDSPTSSPTVKRKPCENQESFQFKGDATKTCDYVAKNPNKRCKKVQPGPGNKKVKFFCPSACKKKCKNTDSPTSSPTFTRGDCENLDSFQFEGNAHRTCDSYVAKKPNKRCKKKQLVLGTKIKLKFFCPATCKRKCKNIDSPTATPTATPTLSPSASPTASPSISASSAPSPIPSVIPSFIPSESPSVLASAVPSSILSGAPSLSAAPSISAYPSSDPTATVEPTDSVAPSSLSSLSPSSAPSLDPSSSPSLEPSTMPSNVPTETPSTTFAILFATDPSITQAEIEEGKPKPILFASEHCLFYSYQLLLTNYLLVLSSFRCC